MSNASKRETFVPVYLVTGFLESGKTSLIHNMLSDEGFSRGQRTMILCCEEGIEEYDEALLKKGNATVVMLEDPSEEDLSQEDPLQGDPFWAAELREVRLFQAGVPVSWVRLPLVR